MVVVTSSNSSSVNVVVTSSNTSRANGSGYCYCVAFVQEQRPAEGNYELLGHSSYVKFITAIAWIENTLTLEAEYLNTGN